MKTLCFALSCFFSLSAVTAQQIDTNLAKYSTSFTTERVYLHFDKSSYMAGETIWFKAYLTEELYPAEKSKTLYVDWMTDDGTVLYHTVAPIVTGNTSGQFEIPSDINADFIHVRAYTKWMLNFDTAFLFKKDIHLLNKTVKTANAKPASSPVLSFFPEGGDLIESVSNRVAFKANDQWGLPVKIKGVIIDNNR